MSIFHLSVKSISRSTGRSAVAAAAYRAGERLTNNRDGRIHDYTNKPVLEAFIMAPTEAPPWAMDRSSLWNAAEAAEKRKDAKVAREYELALPAELSASERRALTVAFAEELVERYKVAVDIAIHQPSQDGDQRNHHAHLLTTTRELKTDGLGTKTRILDVSSTASVEVEALREKWGALSNSALERAKIPRRMDHRSFKRQGVEFEPTIKLGPIASAIEQRASRRLGQGSNHEPVTERGHLNALIKEMRTLSNNIDRGRKFLNHMRHEAMRMTKQKLLRLYADHSPITSLQQAVGRASDKRVATQNPSHRNQRSIER